MTFNARVETVATKPMFRDAFKRRRCLIPASGYYEWLPTPTGKQPYYYTSRDGSPLTIAGLWDEWKDTETRAPLPSCTLIVTDANALAAKVHDRMPVLLQPQDFDGWLSGRRGRNCSSQRRTTTCKSGPWRAASTAHARRATTRRSSSGRLRSQTARLRFASARHEPLVVTPD